MTQPGIEPRSPGPLANTLTLYANEPDLYIYIYIYIGCNDKIVVLKKTTLQLYFKTFIKKINSGNFIM